MATIRIPFYQLHNRSTTMETIEIENLKCSGCANTIKNKLMSINGVVDVIVNQETETVIVEGTAHRTELIELLSAIGYPEIGNNSVGKKMMSYISCASGKFSEN